MDIILYYEDYIPQKKVFINQMKFKHLLYLNYYCKTNFIPSKDIIILSGLFNCKEIIDYYSEKDKIKPYHLKYLAYYSKNIYIFEKNIHLFKRNIELMKFLANIALLKANFKLYYLLDNNFLQAGVGEIVDINFVLQYSLDKDTKILYKYLEIVKEIIDRLFVNNNYNISKIIYGVLESKENKENIFIITRFLFEKTNQYINLNNRLQYLAIAYDNNHKKVIDYLLSI